MQVHCEMWTLVTSRWCKCCMYEVCMWYTHGMSTITTLFKQSGCTQEGHTYHMSNTNGLLVYFTLTYPYTSYIYSLWPVACSMPVEKFAHTFLLYRLTEWSRILKCPACLTNGNFLPADNPCPRVRTVLTYAFTVSIDPNRWPRMGDLLVPLYISVWTK